MPSVWFWPPNSISESLEFLTDIRKSRTVEIRDSYKDATQRLKYGYRVPQNIGEALIDLYRSQPTGRFLVPEWATATIMRTGVVTLGQTIVLVEDESVFTVGGDVFIGNGKHLWEQATIASKAAGQITLTVGIARAYIASPDQAVFIAPLIPSLLPSGLSFSSRFRVTDLNGEFLSLAPIDIAANPYPTFGGLPLVTDGRMAFAAQSGAVNRAATLIDSGFGAYELSETEEFTRRYGQVSFFDTDYQSRMERRKFFHFMRGRDGEMWARTGQRDIVLQSAFGSSSITLSITPIAAAARMVGKHIFIKEGANFAAREIVGASDISGTQQDIQISSLGFAGTSSAAISLMHRCRLDDDIVNLSYRFTPSGLKCSTVLNIVEVP